MTPPWTLVKASPFLGISGSAPPGSVMTTWQSKFSGCLPSTIISLAKLTAAPAGRWAMVVMIIDRRRGCMRRTYKMRSIPWTLGDQARNHIHSWITGVDRGR